MYLVSNSTLQLLEGTVHLTLTAANWKTHSATQCRVTGIAVHAETIILLLQITPDAFQVRFLNTSKYEYYFKLTGIIYCKISYPFCQKTWL